MWSYFLRLHSSLAAALRTDCTIQETLRRADEHTVAAIDLRCDEGCDCRSRCLERQRFDAAFQETKLTEAATDGSSDIQLLSSSAAAAAAVAPEATTACIPLLGGGVAAAAKDSSSAACRHTVVKRSKSKTEAELRWPIRDRL